VLHSKDKTAHVPWMHVLSGNGAGQENMTQHTFGSTNAQWKQYFMVNLIAQLPLAQANNHCYCKLLQGQHGEH